MSVGLTSLVKSDLLNLIRRSGEYLQQYRSQITFTIKHSDGSSENIDSLPYDGSSSSPNKYFQIKEDGYAFIIFHRRNARDASCPEELYINVPVDALAIVNVAVYNIGWNVNLLDGGGGVIQGMGQLFKVVKANSDTRLISTCGRYTTNGNEIASVLMYIYLIEL